MKDDASMELRVVNEWPNASWVLDKEVRPIFKNGLMQTIAIVGPIVLMIALGALLFGNKKRKNNGVATVTKINKGPFNTEITLSFYDSGVACESIQSKFSFLYNDALEIGQEVPTLSHYADSSKKFIDFNKLFIS